MTRTLTIDQINELEHGTPIPRFQGTIRKVLDQKSDMGQYGQWWLQTLFVGAPGVADDIAVTWTGEDPFDQGVEGQLYSFECTEDKQGKLVGVTRDIRTKGGRTYSGVKVDNRSKIKRVIENDPEYAGKFQHPSPEEQERRDEMREKGERFREPADPDWPEAESKPPDSYERQKQTELPPKPKNGDKIAEYAKHSGRIFAAAWEESKNGMALIPEQDAKDLSTYEWLDLRLREAIHHSIEIGKIIRKERF